MGLFGRRKAAFEQTAAQPKASERSAGIDGSWLAYPTLTHGDSGMVKLAGPYHHRQEVAKALRRFGPLVLAELRIETEGQWAGAVRVYVGGAQVASVPSEQSDTYRDVVETLARDGRPATIHAELELDSSYVDVWGLCKPAPRAEGEPLLPTQYDVDVRLLDGMAAQLDASLNSKAKEKKLRRYGALNRRPDGVWEVFDGGRAIGTLDPRPYSRLDEAAAAGFPLDVVVTVHRSPGRELRVHAAVPHNV